jgi:hypothetical protein
VEAAMTALVFSKDRALQLDAFLRSVARFVTPRPRVDVIWLATSIRHRQAYDEVFLRHPWAVAHEEMGGSFKAAVLACLPSDGSVVFFVDDLVFIRPWAVTEMPGLSLRLGLHLTDCYPTARRQGMPRVTIDAGLVTWRWADGEGDWGYPLSLDGHVFDLAELRPLIAAIPFTSPNTLEAALQRFAPAFLTRMGTCYYEARIVNVPWNRVQQDWANRCAGDPAATPEQLLTVWEQGQQIDLAPLVGVRPASCHQEFPLTVEARP